MTDKSNQSQAPSIMKDWPSLLVRGCDASAMPALSLAALSSNCVLMICHGGVWPQRGLQNCRLTMLTDSLGNDSAFDFCVDPAGTCPGSSVLGMKFSSCGSNQKHPVEQGRRPVPEAACLCQRRNYSSVGVTGTGHNRHQSVQPLMRSSPFLC